MKLNSFKLLLENIHSPTLIVGENEQAIAFNEAFRDLAGIEGKKIPELEDLFDVENMEEFRSSLRQMRGYRDKVMVGINLKQVGLNVRLLMTVVPTTAKHDSEAALLIFSREGEGSIYTDFLTKLPNRQEAAIRLRYEWNRSMRADSTFSLALADIDHFKSVNDTLGHEAGDHVLIHVAKILNEEIRGSDWCARWGGEEFMILLNDSSAKEAEIVLNRVRTKLQQLPPVFQENPVPVTLSFGLVSKGPAYKSYKDMVNDADVLLYESKAAGRNRVTLFETQGRAVAWGRKEIVAVVEQEVVRPLFRPILDDGKPIGYEVVPTLPGNDQSQMRRLWQSADGLNLLKDLQVQILRHLLKESKAATKDGKNLVLPIPVRLATDPNFLKAVVDDGIKKVDGCALMLEGNLDLGEDALRQLQQLRDHGFRLAVRDVEFNKIPLKFLSMQEVSLMFVKLDDVMRGKAASGKNTIMKDLLESIRAGGTKVIGIQDSEDHKAGGAFAGIVSGYLCRRHPAQKLSAAGP